MREDNCYWYHGNISRDTASNKLRLNNTRGEEGYFLIRDCSSAPGDYSLSVWSRQRILNFQIQCLNDNNFVIDQGPIFQGLDSLVKHYQANPDGLPCKLGSFCPDRLPPLSTLKYGRDTNLHIACVNNNRDEVTKILQNPAIDINARNKAGQTCLHIVCSNSNNELLTILLQARADTSSLDANGNSPLQIACVNGDLTILKTLVLKGNANIHERSMINSWVPLHEVAMRGYLDCVKFLISCNASLHPRTIDGDTPKELASRYGRIAVERYIDSYQIPPPKTSLSHWLHQDLDRNGAVEKLSQMYMSDGLFLVRTSIKCRGYCDYVLSLCFNGKVYNFQIKSQADRWFYIDDGPLFETLPHLVDHYMKHSDGLPTVLKKPFPPQSSSPPTHKINNASGKTPLPPKPSIRPRPSQPDTNRRPVPPSLSMNSSNVDDDVGGFQKLKISPALPKPLILPTPPPPNRSQPGQTMILSTSLEKHEKLGDGEFGSVFQGVWINPTGERIRVAMKTLHQDKLVQGEKEFLREAKVMSQLDHPCIVRLLGVCLGPPMILVQELVAMGALLDYLMDYTDSIGEVDIKLWAAQIAWGMTYLEQKRFVHRDLATRNILLANKNQCKISDFGLSRAVGSGSDYYQAQQGGRWPVKWYAPESITYGTFSQKSDVWSYGVTLWEMWSFGELPYGELSGGQVIELLEAGKRLDKPDGCPDHSYNIMLRCWNARPADRPTFKELHDIFSTDPEYEDARSLRERLKN